MTTLSHDRASQRNADRMAFQKQCRIDEIRDNGKQLGSELRKSLTAGKSVNLGDLQMAAQMSQRPDKFYKRNSYRFE